MRYFGRCVAVAAATFLALWLVPGCGRGGKSVSGVVVIEWRGAIVSGPTEFLEEAYQTLPPGWSPAGWGIVVEPGPFPCFRGLCRGTTDTHRRIRVVENVDVARWELGNARCYDLRGALEDVGWTCSV